MTVSSVFVEYLVILCVHNAHVEKVYFRLSNVYTCICLLCCRMSGYRHLRGFGVEASINVDRNCARVLNGCTQRSGATFESKRRRI